MVFFVSSSLSKLIRHYINEIHVMLYIFTSSFNLIVFGFISPTREFFSEYGDVTITREGLQILTYAHTAIEQ